MQGSNVMILRTSGREWLHDAITAGLLDGDVLRCTQEVLQENARLRARNAQLRMRVKVLEEVRSNFYSVHLHAYENEIGKDRAWREGMALRASVTALLCAITFAGTIILMSLLA